VNATILTPFRLFLYLLWLADCLLVPYHPVQAQYYFDHLNTAEGLSQSTVKVTFQDTRGFLWFGTTDGLNRYDGYEFRRFRHQANDANSLCGNDIMALTEDASGNIWVGTRANGLCYFDPRTEQFHSVRVSTGGENLHELDVAALTRSPDQTLWIGTNIGLFYVPSSKQAVSRLETCPRQYISALLTDHTGTLWMGTYQGELFAKKPNAGAVSRWTLPLQSESNQHKWITSLYEDTQRTLYVGTWGSGLYSRSAGQTSFRSKLFFADEFEKRNIIKAIVQTKNGTLWLATDDGLVLVPAGDFSRVQHIRSGNGRAGSLTTHALQSLLTDSFGNVWIGTWEGGLNVYYAEAKRFNHLTQTDGLPGNRVTGVVATPQTLVVSTAKGLAIQNRATGQLHLVAEGRDVTDLLLHDGQLAAIVWNQGTDFYLASGGSLKLTRQQRDPGNPYRAMTPSRRFGWVMANTTGQLFRLMPGSSRFEPLPVLNQTPSFAVATTLYETRSGRLFIGSYNQGLWQYDPQTQLLQPVGHRQRIGNEQIFCIYEDAAGRLWIGTNGNGLFRYKPEADDFQSYTTESGLASNVVKSIIEDSRHRLWIGTNEGLSRFDPQTDAWRTFSEKDGLNNREFMPRAAFRDLAGQLFFGGMDGVDQFHPDSLGATRQRPRVYLTGLRILNKPVAVAPSPTGPNTDESPLHTTVGFASELRLTHRQAASITLEFVGLFFGRKAECQYQYRLDGLDPDWNDVGSQRNATYTNLAPGTYTFRVKAANADGVWGNQEASLALVVLPPWYRSGWAYALYALLFLAALWGYRRFVRQREKLKAEVRFRQLEAEQAHELEQLKTNFFTNISHEFRTPLTLILDPVEQLEQGNLPADRIQESYRIIRQNGQRLLRLINELLDLSKIEAERYRLHIEHADVVEFLARITHSFDLQAERRQVDLRFESDAPACMADFSPDALEKIAFNLIANAIKACRPGDSVTVSVQTTHPTAPANSFVLTVQDTGVGLTETDQKALFARFFQVDNRRSVGGTGIGLALTAELVKLHKGQIHLKSQPGEGTTVTVELTAKAAHFPAEWISHEPLASSSQPNLSVELPETLPVALAQTGQKQVLIVEDNDELRTYLHRQLSTRYAVLVAENGQMGLDLARQHVPDLIVSDVIMPVQTGPELDGIELCQRLKADEKTSHIPVILLTSRASVESQLQGLSTGADDYQTKPFTYQLLEARIETLIRNRQTLRERFSRGMLLQPALIAVTDTDEEFLKRAMATVETHIADSTFDVERLESALNMSQMQLYRKLTSLTNMSGNVFIRHVRLHRAKQLLEESNLTVAEVAYRVGFNSPSYFTRAYKKEFGVLPSGVAL
jgi:signal transduction histidine kinase/ligand-binding sensor domain-containing protein/DNA-binding response OmpR family regulator